MMELCVARGGSLKGARTMSFIAAWAIASNALGREITLEEYADWWRESHGAAYRHQARFREMFPGMMTPQPIADVANSRAAEWASRGIKGFGQMPAAILLRTHKLGPRWRTSP